MVHFLTLRKGKRISIESYATSPHRLRPAYPAHPRDAGHQREHGGGGLEIRQRHTARLGAGKIGGLCAANCRRSGARTHQLCSTWRTSTRSATSEVRLLQTLANAMSVALENARLFDETQRRTREAAALAEVGRDISSTLDVATVMDRIAQHAKDLLNADNSAIFLPSAGSTAYRAIVAVGDIADELKDDEIEPGVGIIGKPGTKWSSRTHQRYQ